MNKWVWAWYEYGKGLCVRLLCRYTVSKHSKKQSNLQDPAGILNKLNRVDTSVYLLMSTCYNRFLNRFQAPGKIWKDEVDAFCRCEGWTFSHSRSWVKVCQLWTWCSETAALPPKSKGCRLLVYSTTEVQINHHSITYLQRSPETKIHCAPDLPPWQHAQNRTLCLTRNRSYKLKTNSLSFNFRWVCG